jgi:hypothetical protein
MKPRRHPKTVVFARVCLSLGLCLGVDLGWRAPRAHTQTQPKAVPVQKEKKAIMTNHASGTFDVKMTPQAADDKAGDGQAAGAAIGRYSLDKQFHGGLEGTSEGEMLAVGTAVEGSAGYVAMEQVTGTLNGRKGSFALQPTGTMTRGAGQLNITVVPDSGTGELAGLAGKLEIKIADGKHFYDFAYTLAATE